MLFLAATSCFGYACTGGAPPGAPPSSGETGSAAPPDGQRLFVENCAACHQRDRDATGPALAGVVSRWEGDTARLRGFIRNSGATAEKGDPRARELQQKWNVAMPPYTDFTNRDIDAILGYIEAR